MHPSGWSLRCEDVGSAEEGLNLIGGVVGRAVRHEHDGGIGSSLTPSVEPDDQGAFSGGSGWCEAGVGQCGAIFVGVGAIGVEGVHKWPDAPGFVGPDRSG